MSAKALMEIQGRKKLRVLHLASFAGNIGDLANHAGARLMFSRHLDFDLEFSDLEIREFYWKLRSFDDAFIDWANGFDLLLIGGGNYFELWVERSATGTSIDISSERMARLTVSTVFYSLGVDTGQGYTQESAARFCGFLANALDRDMFVCVRNDGSTRALHEVAGATLAQRVPMMPDGGFFSSDAIALTQPAASLRLAVGINIAGDMLDRRFDQGQSPAEFLAGFADFCVRLLEARPDVDIRLVPHIWRDVALIAELLPLIPDRYLRRRVVVAELHPTVAGLPGFMRSYADCAVVLGMRFHANVCPISLGRPTRGLFCYPQVEKLYAELGLPERICDVRSAGFADRLLTDTLADLERLPEIREQYRELNLQLNQCARTVLASMNHWLHARHPV